MKQIETLEQLADFINANEDYDNKAVEAACSLHGWTLGEDEWHIANDGKQQVIFDDNGTAVVTPL